jgi:hypothetical protein
LANTIENGNVQRKHYDLFVMDMIDAIRDVCAIGIDQTNIIFDDFSIELSNTVDDVYEQGEEFISLFDKAFAQVIDLTKEYAILLLVGGYASRVNDLLEEGIISISGEEALALLESNQNRYAELVEPVETFELLEKLSFQ